MASFKREYDTATNAGVNNQSVTDQGFTSNFVTFGNGAKRGAQVSVILTNEETEVTCDLLIEIFASRDGTNLDGFPATEFRLRPEVSMATDSFTFDVPDSVAGHAFKVKLTSVGDTSICDEYTVTLDVQVYNINNDT